MDVESSCILKNCNWNSISFDDCISGRKQQSKPNSAPFFCARNFRQYKWQQFQEANKLHDEKIKYSIERDKNRFKNISILTYMKLINPIATPSLTRNLKYLNLF